MNHFTELSTTVNMNETIVLHGFKVPNLNVHVFQPWIFVHAEGTLYEGKVALESFIWSEGNYLRQIKLILRQIHSSSYSSLNRLKKTVKLNWRGKGLRALLLTIDKLKTSLNYVSRRNFYNKTWLHL